MRKFGTDAPEFFVFQIEGDDTTYKIPLMASMKDDDIEKYLKVEEAKNDIERYRNARSFLKSFIGDAIDKLTLSDMWSMFSCWAKATEKQGADVGES